MTGPLTEEQFQAIERWIDEAIAFAMDTDLRKTGEWVEKARDNARRALVSDTRGDGE
jgi:hypothetical protein